MSRLLDLLPSPESRNPLTRTLFFQDIIAPLLCCYATAVLVVTPNTRLIRICVLPLTLWTLFNTATQVDAVKYFKNSERLVFWNMGLTIVSTALGMRIVVWTFQRRPFIRVTRTNVRTTQPSSTFEPKQVLMDAFDLSCNLRGIGWDWSRHLKIPHETRPTNSRIAFAAATFLSMILHLVMFDLFHYLIQWLGPTTIGSAHGGSIFDSSLPPLLRYSKSTVVTFFAGMSVYASIQAGYHIPTILGVLVFQQDPSLWPPAFNSPWLSTSLTEFWAQRWHQLFRDVFVTLGGKPLSFFGRAGGVLGVFTASGILHDVGLWGMGRGTDFLKVGGFFIINGFGVCLEHLWRRTTGYRVSGWYGRLWTWIWVVGWGHLLVEAWATRGLIGSEFLPQNIRPTTYLFGGLW